MFNVSMAAWQISIGGSNRDPIQQHIQILALHVYGMANTRVGDL